MSLVSARKALKRSLKSLDAKKNPADHELHTALLYMAGALQQIEAKLDRLEAAAGTTPPAGSVKSDA